MKLFKGEHRIFGVHLSILAVIATFAASFFVAPVSHISSQKSHTLLNAQEIEVSIAEITGQPVYTDLTNDESSTIALSANGNLTSSAPVFTETVSGSFRYDISFHTVGSGDTLSALSKQYGITSDSILWANGIEDAESLKPGQQLVILPVSGVLHTVAAGETVESIASKYKADAARLLSFNDLETRKIESGMKVIVPDGVKSVKAKKKAVAYSYSYKPGRSDGGGWFVGYFPRQSGKFAGGYCTSYLQHRKGYIPWYGNAKQWPSNASAAGYATGSAPKVGSIYVEPWLTWAGHVSLVEEVRPDGSFVIKEGNNSRYGGYGKENARIIPAGAGGIFIYF